MGPALSVSSASSREWWWHPASARCLQSRLWAAKAESQARSGRTKRRHSRNDRCHFQNFVPLQAPSSNRQFLLLAVDRYVDGNRPDLWSCSTLQNAVAPHSSHTVLFVVTSPPLHPAARLDLQGYTSHPLSLRGSPALEAEKHRNAWHQRHPPGSASDSNAPLARRNSVRGLQCRKPQRVKRRPRFQDPTEEKETDQDFFVEKLRNWSDFFVEEEFELVKVLLLNFWYRILTSPYGEVHVILSRLRHSTSAATGSKHWRVMTSESWAATCLHTWCSCGAKSAEMFHSDKPWLKGGSTLAGEMLIIFILHAEKKSSLIHSWFIGIHWEQLITMLMGPLSYRWFQLPDLSPWKTMVGRLLSFWEVSFSGVNSLFNF